MLVCKCNADSTRALLFDRIAVADTFFTRLAGLIFKGSLSQNEGLLLQECNSIHTMWMRFKIDVLFLAVSGGDISSGYFRVVDLIENMKPFTFSRIVRGASDVLELKSGAIARCSIKKDDLLYFASES